MANNSRKKPVDETGAVQKGPVREYVEAILIAFLLALFIRSFIVQAFKIPSGSMEDTLLIGDHILVTKYNYGLDLSLNIPFTSITFFKKAHYLTKTPQRGDIVVFKYPRDETKDYIKRVIGLPGDELKIRFRKVYINGTPIDEPYAYHKDAPNTEPAPLQDDFGPVRIPEGHIFVMGDNREHSHDSRFWGFLNIENIRGKAKLIYWSWDGERSRVRFDRLTNILH
jgi:signal peptidase I